MILAGVKAASLIVSVIENGIEKLILSRESFIRFHQEK
jgi:hypothetical protein